MFRSWEPVDDRISIMRQALAEYPANEELLVRLGIALWYKWSQSVDDEYERYLSMKDGKVLFNFDLCRAHEGWEEPVKIFEGLLSISVNDKIRMDCHQHLSYIYGAIGEKDKVYQIAEQHPWCKNNILYAAFNGKYEEARASSQSLILEALSHIWVHLPLQVNDLALQARTNEKIIELYQFVFSDGNYGFYNSSLNFCYCSYAEALIKQNKTDEAISALEKAFEYAKKFDIYLDKLRRDGEYLYTSVFVDSVKDVSEDVYAVKEVPELLEKTLLDENSFIYKVLHGNPKYEDLVRRVKEEIAK